jgi:hypothetical protein
MMTAPRDTDAEPAPEEDRRPASEEDRRPAPEEDRRPAPARERRPGMSFRISLEPAFLRAELTHRETVDEMRQFLRAVVRNSARCPHVLISVRASHPLFHVERDGLVEFLRQIAQVPQHRIALLADAPDLQASHEYLELIARQRGVCVRSFRGESEALQWFADRRALQDRRAGGERRQGNGNSSAPERRRGADRRQMLRRAPGAA